MRNFGGMGVYPCRLHCWWVFLPIFRAMFVFIFVFELGKVVVVVEFLFVYPLALYLWAGILVCHPTRFFIFVLVSLLRCIGDGCFAVLCEVVHMVRFM